MISDMYVLYSSEAGYLVIQVDLVWMGIVLGGWYCVFNLFTDALFKIYLIYLFYNTKSSQKGKMQIVR